jgi:hypothetical protein
MARADALAEALSNALERLGPAAADIEFKAARAFIPGA